MTRYVFLALVSLLIICECMGKKKPSVQIEIESKPNECGEGAVKGSTVLVHYTGALENGQVFDTSRREGGSPFTVTLGAGKVIKGWEEGLLGMCPGEVRKLVIPPHLGYGDQGVPNVIPPKSTLVFSVELLEIKQKPLIPLPKGTGFYTILGIVVICLLVGYELYKRANQQSKDAKKQKKHHSSKSGKKHKNKQQ